MNENITVISPMNPPDGREFPMKPENREYFLTEQRFLNELANHIFQEIETPEEKRAYLFRHIEDLSSTTMANIAMTAYGLSEATGFKCLSDSKVVEQLELDIDSKAINISRKVVLQTLWFRYSELFTEDNPISSIMSKRYIKLGENANNEQTKVAKRAEGNLSYYENRLLILQHQDEIVTLLYGIYGEDTKKKFSSYYRLGEFNKNSYINENGQIENEVYEKTGNYTIEATNQADYFAERLSLLDALEVGRKVTEYILDQKISWTNIVGKEVDVYRRKGLYFETVLKEYQKQLSIQKALDELDENQDTLLPTEIELLRLTTSYTLSGGTKIQGLQEFNKKYGSKHINTYVKNIEDKLLELTEDDTEYTLTILRKKNLKTFLKGANQEYTASFIGKIADMLYDYHVAGVTNETVAEQLGINPYTTGELRRFLERILFAQNDDHSLRRKGDISVVEITECFEENDQATVPAELIRIIEIINTCKSTRDAAQKIKAELSLNFEVPSIALSTLRNLVSDTVAEVDINKNTYIEP